MLCNSLHHPATTQLSESINYALIARIVPFVNRQLDMQDILLR
jgi:hypothetical protein